FLALMGWSPDGETTVMSREEIIERFTLERVGASPATFDYTKLDWLNGVYLRAMSHEELADALVAYLGDQGYDWSPELVAKAAPIVQDKISRLDEFPGFAGFLFHDVQPEPAQLDGPILAAAVEALGSVEPWAAVPIEGALKALCERLARTPREVY